MGPESVRYRTKTVGDVLGIITDKDHRALVAERCAVLALASNRARHELPNLQSRRCRAYMAEIITACRQVGATCAGQDFRQQGRGTPRLPLSLGQRPAGDDRRGGGGAGSFVQRL